MKELLRVVECRPPEKPKEEPMYGVRCPAFKCTNVLGYPDVQNCVSAELLEEFDTFILNKALEHIPNMTYVVSPPPLSRTIERRE